MNIRGFLGNANITGGKYNGKTFQEIITNHGEVDPNTYVLKNIINGIRNSSNIPLFVDDNYASVNPEFINSLSVGELNNNTNYQNAIKNSKNLKRNVNNIAIGDLVGIEWSVAIDGKTAYQGTAVVNVVDNNQGNSSTSITLNTLQSGKYQAKADGEGKLSNVFESGTYQKDEYKDKTYEGEVKLLL